MIAKRWVMVVAQGLLAMTIAGCGTSPPGGGVTNGPEPSSAPETSAVRTDIPPPDIPAKDLAPGNDQSTSPPAPASPSSKTP